MGRASEAAKYSNAWLIYGPGNGKPTKLRRKTTN